MFCPAGIVGLLVLNLLKTDAMFPVIVLMLRSLLAWPVPTVYVPLQLVALFMASVVMVAPLFMAIVNPIDVTASLKFKVILIDAPAL